MVKYRLNSSYGEYSAGTVVEVVYARDLDKVITVTRPISPPDEFFDVPIILLTKCRSMTDLIPALTRRERRRGIERKPVAGGSGAQDAFTSNSESPST